MHLDSLVAAQILARGHRTSFDARAEDEYYRSQMTLPRPGLRLLGPVATAAGLILLLVGIAHA
jgi:hypothetical protein